MAGEPLNLVDYIFTHAKQVGRWTAPALITADDDRTLTYADLEVLSNRARGLLQKLGVGPGDRVALVMLDTPEWIALFLAATGLGAVSVNASTLLSAEELAYVLNHSGARVVAVTSDQAGKLAEIRAAVPSLEQALLINLPNAAKVPEAISSDNFLDFAELLKSSDEVPLAATDADTLALLAYTSGSTGKPKGVMHVHRDVPAVIETYGRHVLQVEPTDRHFASSRLFFTYGLGGSLLFPLSQGATTILSATPPRPDLIARIFATYRPTTFFGVPSVYRGLLEYHRQGNELDTSSLKYGVTAGEAMPAALYHDWYALTGVTLVDGIGSTEMLHTFIANRRHDVRPGSSGWVVPGYEAKLVSEAGQEILGAGTGDLFVCGPSQSPGYWSDPEKTAETIIDGWMRTGDVYRRDDEGVYWFEGRSDDMFKAKGTWVSPLEVEEVLLTHLAVREAAVVAGRDQDGLGIVVAYIAARTATVDQTLLDEISQHTRRHLPGYKCPQEIRVVEQLPRTATGKVQRFKLRQLETGAG